MVERQPGYLLQRWLQLPAVLPPPDRLLSDKQKSVGFSEPGNKNPQLFPPPFMLHAPTSLV